MGGKDTTLNQPQHAQHDASASPQPRPGDSGHNPAAGRGQVRSGPGLSTLIGASSALLLVPVAALGGTLTGTRRGTPDQDQGTNGRPPANALDVGTAAPAPVTADDTAGSPAGAGPAQPGSATEDGEPDTASPPAAAATGGEVPSPDGPPHGPDAGSSPRTRAGRARASTAGRVRRRAAAAGADEPRAGADEAAAVAREADPATDDATAAALPTGQAAPPSTVALPGAKSPRKRVVERAQRRQQAAEQVIAAADDNNASLGPLVRHLNAVTVQLTDAHRIIGRLSAERDALRRQIAELQGLPIPAAEADPVRSNREARAEAKASKQASQGIVADPAVDVTDPEEIDQADDVGRQRRIIALSALAVIFVGIIIYRFLGFSWFPNISSRESLAQIAFIGPFVQVFLVAWILFRVVRVGGKGARWLFPDQDKQRKRRRS